MHFLVREGAPLAAAIAAGMCVLSYRRYLDRRWQMTELIFATAVILSKTGAPAGAAPAVAE